MADKKYESLKIENIVASGVIAESLDLGALSGKIKNCELNKKRFPGAVCRIEDPKMASLIFSSGKIVLTGSRTTTALADGLAVIIKSLNDAGFETLKEPRVAINNMVCSYDLGRYINLNRVVVTLDLENIEYEPNSSPGLSTGSKIPKLSSLSSLQERSILTGGRNLEDIRKGIDVLEHKLESVL